MGRIVSIELENARFYAYHGYYPEEQILGNEYDVSIKAQYTFADIDTENLAHTVNYETLYQIAKKKMSQPRKLLETVASDILKEINAQFSEIIAIEISIVKINPPFGADKATAKVSLHWTS
ncbi:dihydroneopterin aldolase [Albibacterium indicum]|uniref:dihydroneopterin aldolase n=1 Tax=Albibacterium indicum TaxID=2292082 RepID=UPI000E505BA8|nr:dihydroneopterin aldolase [Pedobacter indicus]